MPQDGEVKLFMYGARRKPNRLSRPVPRSSTCSSDISSLFIRSVQSGASVFAIVAFHLKPAFLRETLKSPRSLKPVHLLRGRLGLGLGLGHRGHPVFDFLGDCFDVRCSIVNS